MTRRTFVVHASSLLARGFIAESPDRRSDDGKPTNALFALSRALRRALAFKTPDLAVAVMDADPPDAEWPALLKEQLAPLPALLEAHGIHVVTASDAAHVVASYVQATLDEGNDAIIISSDKRFAQLVSEEVWWYDAYKDVRYTPELVRKRFEVLPAFVSGWLALVGDDDTLPGVKGLGKKGAKGLVETYGSIAQAIAQAEEVEGRSGKALRASLDDAKREVQRAKLHRDRALPRPLSDLDYREPDVSALNELYRELSFYTLLETDEEVALEVVVCDDDEKAAAFLAGLTGDPVAMHVLIEDPSPPRGDLVGLALAQGGRAAYFPFHADALPSLKSWLGSDGTPKLGHDAKSVTLAYARHAIDVRGIVGDSACASHLTEPSGMAPHDLPRVARRVLRRAVDEDDAVRGVGRRRKKWGDLKIDKAAAWAGNRADISEALWNALSPSIDKELLAEYLALSGVCVRMELNGIACDSDDLAQVGEDFIAIETGLEKQIYEHAGKEFNIGSTKQLGSVLYEDLELPILKRTKTGWSTANEALERLEHAHPIVSLVMRWRRLRRLRDSWVTALRASIDADGRVRSSFNPARSFSGRIVNAAPDMGRVPGKTPEMVRIRQAFHAPAGSTLLSVDYNQLGLYVLAHLTRDPALVEPLRNGEDMHTLTAMAVLELPREKIGPDERQTGKVVNFATFAGQGPSALGLQLGVTPAEAKLLVARFHKRYSVVRTFQNGELERAQTEGFITTIAGRRWPIGDLKSLDIHMRSYAERLARRATHEGSVADVTRRGLLRADQALRAEGLRAFPLLQVHDEVLFEVPDDELHDAARVTAEAMRHAFELEVPLQVGCKVGRTWGDLKPLDG